jgi:hypothetical protein
MKQGGRGGRHGQGGSFLRAREDGRPAAAVGRKGGRPWKGLCVRTNNNDEKKLLVAARKNRGVGMKNSQVCKGEGSYL